MESRSLEKPYQLLEWIKKKLSIINNSNTPPNKNSDNNNGSGTWKNVEGNVSNNNNDNNNFRIKSNLKRLGNIQNPFRNESANSIINMVNSNLTINTLSNYSEYLKRFNKNKRKEELTLLINGDIQKLENYKKYISNLNKTKYTNEDKAKLNNLINKIDTSIENMKNILQHSNKLISNNNLNNQIPIKSEKMSRNNNPLGLNEMSVNNL